MADDNWQKVREIFDSALRRKPEEREEFVHNACEGDKALLGEVQSLLASLDNADSFLETPAVAEIAEAITSNGDKLEKGHFLGHYEIIEPVGSGGMGDVYLARDAKLDRQVAIKLLNQKVSQEETSLQRFIREAKAASALNHPNILTIYEFGDAADGHFIVSEFIEGRTLREIIYESSLELSDILNVSIQTAAALSAAHKAHLVHRDIKPENIMIRPDGYVKILDFGLAKLVQPIQSLTGLGADTARQNETARGVILGTVNYMSPEQAKGERVDERTDIFSLGSVIYEMLAGNPPFARNSMSETLGAVITAEPPQLPDFVENVPEDLQAIVFKCLRKEPGRRYQSMDEVLSDLKHLGENLVLEAKLKRLPAPDGPTGWALRAATGGTNKQTAEAQHSFTQQIARHKPLAASGLLVLLVAFTAVGYWLFYSRWSSASQIESIAVFPFVNQSGDVNLDYLSDGLSESIIDRLSALPQLKVIARNSSFKFRGQDDWQQAAATFGVRAVVTGRVMVQGDSLTIRVELVDVRDNRQLWSQQYTRGIGEASVVQEDITQMISERLSLNLSGEQRQQAAQRKSVNAEAFELTLKGRFHSYKGGTENWKKAAEYFERAIAADSGYAPAYAALFWTYRNLFTRGVVDPREFIPKAEQVARKALELDPNLADAHLAIAYMRRDGWKWDEAEASYKRAIELGPNLAPAHGAYSAFLSLKGRHAEAVAEAKRAGNLDPFSPLFGTNTGFVLFLARRYDESIEVLQKTLEADRNNSNAHLLLGLAYTEKKMYPEAIAAHQEAIRVDKMNSNLQILLAATHARAGEPEQARVVISQLPTEGGRLSPAYFAILYAALGEREQAFAALEQAHSARDPQLQHISVSPPYDSLREDPRFDALIERLGLR